MGRGGREAERSFAHPLAAPPLSLPATRPLTPDMSSGAARALQPIARSSRAARAPPQRYVRDPAHASLEVSAGPEGPSSEGPLQPERGLVTGPAAQLLWMSAPAPLVASIAAPTPDTPRSPLCGSLDQLCGRPRAGVSAVCGRGGERRTARGLAPHSRLGRGAAVHRVLSGHRAAWAHAARSA